MGIGISRAKPSGICLCVAVALAHIMEDGMVAARICSALLHGHLYHEMCLSQKKLPELALSPSVLSVVILLLNTLQ